MTVFSFFFLVFVCVCVFVCAVLYVLIHVLAVLIFGACTLVSAHGREDRCSYRHLTGRAEPSVARIAARLPLLESRFVCFAPVSIASVAFELSNIHLALPQHNQILARKGSGRRRRRNRRLRGRGAKHLLGDGEKCFL